MARLLRYLLALATAFVMLLYLISRFRAQATIEDTWDHADVEDYDYGCPLDEPFEYTDYNDMIIWGKPQPGMEPEWSDYLRGYDGRHPELRAEFALGPGGFVRGWPSKGGIYVLSHVFGVELEFLGLDRFNNTARPSIPDPAAASEEEEAHCNKMRQLGARWYKSEEDYRFSNYAPELFDRDIIYVGWPAGGGVWVLFLPSRSYARMDGVAIIHNAFNMEERCKAIEQLGGRFYENPRDCPFLDLP
ncbi:hypothetical protein V8C44DRAFT_345971 [Trichoderma aethiopicum]